LAPARSPLPQDFPADIKSLGGSLVAASVEAYSRICSELLPTPSKVHYTFNLRDLSKVVQGLTGVAPGACGSREQLARLWLHECCRVFHDRLVSEESAACTCTCACACCCEARECTCW
jgi:dynein heavy chain